MGSQAKVCKPKGSQFYIFITSLRACSRDAGPLPVGGHLETSQPSPTTGQAMKKDSQWTQKIDEGQKTKNYDIKHFFNKTDKRLTFETQTIEGQEKQNNDINILEHEKLMKTKDDNETEQVAKPYPGKDTIFIQENYVKNQKPKNENYTVQRTSHMIKDSRQPPISKPGSKENYKNRNDISLSRTNAKPHKRKIINIGKHVDIKCKIYPEQSHIQIKRNRTNDKDNSRLKINLLFKISITLYFCISSVNSYTLRGTTKGMTLLNQNKDQENIDINRIEPQRNVTEITTTTCICPTTNQPTWKASTSTTKSTTIGSTTSSGRCLCPGDVQSLAEEETATNMPNINEGKRRRRKEIEGMDLFVDSFDQKILKKMPFLKSY